MKVLVLGGTGVISRAIVTELVKSNNEVTIFNRGKRNVTFKNDIEEIIGDKKDLQDLKNKMRNRNFDVVIDMISYDEEDGKATVETFKNKTSHIIVTSSSAAYQKPFKNMPIKEDEKLTTDSRFMYGYKKANLERYLNKEITENNTPITIIRPSLTFGVGSQNIGILRQNFGIIDRIKKGKPLIMFGDGTTPVNFTFAPDLAKAYVGLAGNKLSFGETYHATSDEKHIWDDLYLEFGKIIGIEPKIVHLPTEILLKANPDLFGHLFYEKMYSGIFDNTKIKQAVPTYNIELSLNKGLQMITDWFIQSSHIVDTSKDSLEDKLVEVYYNLERAMLNE